MIKKCEYCRAWFTPSLKHGYQMYCSAACRQRAWCQEALGKGTHEYVGKHLKRVP